MTLVISDRTGHFATLTFNRPEARNALSRQLVAEFRAALADLAADDSLRVLIVAATRESPAFCAGADLVERTRLTAEERLEHLYGIGAMCEELAAFPTPVIAAVHGFALAGGSEVALACDTRIAAEGSVFGLPEVCVGIIPGGGGIVRLPRIVGAGRANELLFTGRRISDREALAIGLIDRLVPLEDLDAAVREMAETIAANAPLAVRAVKRALRNSAGLGAAEATQAVLRERAPLDKTRDYLEGITAFAEKRKPVYSGE
jgi:enoyl-CoA hydratase/carnithine racemase